jgi:hypothetical protein
VEDAQTEKPGEGRKTVPAYEGVRKVAKVVFAYVREWCEQKIEAYHDKQGLYPVSDSVQGQINEKQEAGREVEEDGVNVGGRV